MGRDVSRNYSQKFASSIGVVESDSLGVALAKACVTANIPPKLIAKYFSVTRITIHNWFRGAPVRESKKVKISTFVGKVLEDIEKGVLPAKDGKSAKAYIDCL